LKVRYTSSVIGIFLVPALVLVDSMMYSIFDVLCN
jgi:hypothetical protein